MTSIVLDYFAVSEEDISRATWNKCSVNISQGGFTTNLIKDDCIAKEATAAVDKCKVLGTDDPRA